MKTLIQSMWPWAAILLLLFLLGAGINSVLAVPAVGAARLVSFIPAFLWLGAKFIWGK